MFTGIVEDLGEIVVVEELTQAKRISIRSELITQDASEGDSIAVNGVCLTVTSTSDDIFTADVMQETLDRSSLAKAHPRDRVNLERSVKLHDRLGGHLVQGHVDGTGIIEERTPAEHWEIVRITLPKDISRYVVEKGSITVDGTSLTVTQVNDDSFEVSLIPETLKRTTLGRKHKGDLVNLEVDIIGKYVERLLNKESQ